MEKIIDNSGKENFKRKGVEVLVVGDPHIKVNNIVESDIMIADLEKISLERKPDFIVLLGDILDRHSSIHVIPLMKAEQLILTLSKIAPTFVIIGNHDRPNNTNFLTNEHPFNALKLWPNTFVIDTVQAHEIKGMKFLFLPYVSPGRLEEAMNTIPNALENTVAVFQHSEIQGSNYNGIKSTSSDVWRPEYPLGISGHLHEYDFLLKNFIIVGTPFQHTFSEKPDKAVSYFTFTTFEEQISWNQERIKLSIPEKIMEYITVSDLQLYNPPNNKKVKLVIRGDESELKTLGKLEKYRELKEKGVIIVLEAIQEHRERIPIKAKLSYKSRLLMELGSDVNTVKWFQKIFS